MKKPLWILCLVSATAGAVASQAWQASAERRTARAQTPRQGGPRLREPAVDAAREGRGPLAMRPASQRDDDLTAEERVHVAVYEQANRSVVHINTKSVRTDAFGFYESPEEGSGSGSVLDAQGHILTNFHVVDGARQVFVTLFDGKSYEAELVGQDPSTDMAVLRINAPADALHPVTFGDSARLRVGQRVYAIGNPFGLDRTLSTGIISSLNRELPTRNSRVIKSVIQIDASINPGNSGGPLLNTRAEVIGMNTAIASKVGQSAGVGFAISANTIQRIAPQLIRQGRVVRPEVGILAAFPTDQGLRIARMAPGGPAEQAGLRGPQVIRQRRGPFVLEGIDRSAADLIVSVDGKPVKTVDEFLTEIESHQPGQAVTIGILRDGKPLELAVTLTGDDESQL